MCFFIKNIKSHKKLLVNHVSWNLRSHRPTLVYSSSEIDSANAPQKRAAICGLIGSAACWVAVCAPLRNLPAGNVYANHTCPETCHIYHCMDFALDAYPRKQKLCGGRIPLIRATAGKKRCGCVCWWVWCMMIYAEPMKLNNKLVCQNFSPLGKTNGRSAADDMCIWAYTAHSGCSKCFVAVSKSVDNYVKQSH